MDGVAVTLQTSEEAEGEEADGEADEGHGDAHPRDDGEEELVDTAVALRRDRLTFSSMLFIMIGGIKTDRAILVETVINLLENLMN